jgi:peptidyl-tRNA hydrolase, PTH1 family
VFAIIGLGNPGSKYSETRHNAGFRALDVLASELLFPGKSKSISPDVSWERKFECEFLRAKYLDRELLLIKPQKFMNLSGQAACPLVNFFKISNTEVIVVYDDMDLNPGALRLRFSGSAGGHKGVLDIKQHLGTDNFYRVRIGVGKPEVLREGAIVSWVLSSPYGEEKEKIVFAEQLSAPAILKLVEKGLDEAQRLFGRS